MRAEGVGTPDRGRQKPACALYGRVRRRHIGSIKDRPAVDLHDRVMKLDQLQLLVMIDLARLELPQGRRARVVLAEVARGVDAARQLGVIGVGAAHCIGREPRAVGEQHPHVLRKRLAHRIAQLHEIGKDDFAGRLREADIPRGGYGIGALIVGNRVGEQNLTVLGDFDVTAGDRQGQLFVVLDLIGAKQDRGVFVVVGTAAKGELGGRWNCRAHHHQHTEEAPHEPRSDAAATRVERPPISHLPDGAASRRRKSGSLRSASRPPT